MIYPDDMSPKTPAEFAVLGMLSLRPMTGYEIKQAYERGPAHFMSMSYGQIYPILARLAAQNLAQPGKRANGHGSVRYSITVAGTELVRRWIFDSRASMPYKELLLRLFFCPLE